MSSVGSGSSTVEFLTLRRLLTNVKDKNKPEDRQGAVYKIKCCDCQASYIGETGRNLSYVHPDDQNQPFVPVSVSLQIDRYQKSA